MRARAPVAMRMFFAVMSACALPFLPATAMMPLPFSFAEDQLLQVAAREPSRHFARTVDDLAEIEADVLRREAVLIQPVQQVVDLG